MPTGRQRGTGIPTALKILKGGHPENINNDEPIPDDSPPQCPSRDEDVIEVWTFTLRHLQQMQTISAADTDILYTYCEQVVNYRRAAEMVRQDGIVILGPKGPMKHPAVGIMETSGALVARLAAGFGLTPQGRSAIRVGDQRATAGVRSQAPAARLLSS